MKSTKKREIGLGDNLYGIPLDDILSPEQLEQMKKNSPSSQRRRMKNAQKRRKSNKFSFKKIKLPEININSKVLYIIGIAVILLLLIMIFKNPIAARITPKLYVSNAMDESVSHIKDETDKAIKGIFGFDILDAKELTLTAKGGIGADSMNIAENLAINIQAGYSKKSENASSTWQYLHNDEEFASASLYLDNKEIGFNMPQIFGEFWVAPSAQFGKEWNESGLRKALYAETIGEDADLSFSNIFKNRSFLSDKGMKEATKLTKKLFSSANAKYDGKTEIAINDNSKLAREFKFTFNQSDINDYLIDMMQLILNDSASSEILSYMDKLEQTKTLFEDITGRLTDSIHINDATMYFAEYKGAVRSINLQVSYAENGAEPNIEFSASSANLKNITDDLSFDLNFSANDKNVSYALTTSGNHTGNGKKFTDNTSFKIIASDYSYSLDNELSLDFKSGNAQGKLTGSDNYSSKTLSYSGTCGRKKGFEMELNDMWASVAGGVNRNLTGNAYLKIEPDMKVPKFNTTNKKMILDYTKTEAENYLTRLEETDSVKKFLATLDSISKNKEE